MAGFTNAFSLRLPAYAAAVRPAVTRPLCAAGWAGICHAEEDLLRERHAYCYVLNCGSQLERILIALLEVYGDAQ